MSSPNNFDDNAGVCLSIHSPNNFGDNFGLLIMHGVSGLQWWLMINLWQAGSTLPTTYYGETKPGKHGFGDIKQHNETQCKIVQHGKHGDITTQCPVSGMNQFLAMILWLMVNIKWFR